MRGLLIDPVTRTVTDVIVPSLKRDMQPLYDLLTIPGGELPAVDIAQYVQLAETEFMWVDEEGLLKARIPVFNISGRIIAGRGVILGEDKHGEATDSRLDATMVAQAIVWTELESTGHFDPPTEGPNWIKGGDPILSPART